MCLTTTPGICPASSPTSWHLKLNACSNLPSSSSNLAPPPPSPSPALSLSRSQTAGFRENPGQYENWWLGCRLANSCSTYPSLLHPADPRPPAERQRPGGSSYAHARLDWSLRRTWVRVGEDRRARRGADIMASNLPPTAREKTGVKEG